MSKNSRSVPAAPLLVMAMLAACGSPDPAGGRTVGAGGPEPHVVATTGMIADVASRVADGHVRVVGLMPPGVDPHLFKPSEGDVRRLAGADLILYNGLHLEGKMTEILARMARRNPTVAVAETIPPEHLRAVEGFDGQMDPHVWFDVGLWSRTLDPIERELSRLAPEHAATFRQNAERLRQELDDLDRWVGEQVGSIPADQRVLVTAHDAFGYFGHRYGLEVVGLQGISTVTEAGLQDVERLVSLIVERRLRAIFVESSVPRRSIEAVQAACRARGHDVAIGGELFSDSMGSAGTPEGTYVGMVRHNVRTIVEALR
jgi:manganese/zinc/iron transport system substrate-binding protein